MFDLTLFNAYTLFIAIITVWLLIWRYHGGNDDKSYPLIYYFFLVIYVRGFEGAFANEMLFVSICAALLIRFEFLGNVLLRMAKVVEAGCLMYFMVRMAQLWKDQTY